MRTDIDVVVTDNRMEWNLKRKGIKGVTMTWGGDPVLCDMDNMILPVSVDRRVHREFYRSEKWPVCPITGKKIPIAD